LGTVNTELNIVTLGGAGVVEGGYTAYQTGNYNQLQDSFAGIAVAGGTAYGLNRLNPVTFRGQVAPSENAFTEGIQPRGDNMSLLEHANNSPDSGFVGSSSSYDVAGDSYAGWAYGQDGSVYEIQSGRGQNVNSALGSESPFPGDSETAFQGGVNGSEITGVYSQNGAFTSNPYFGLNSTYAGAVGTAYLAGALGTKR
jgi:hypothetical protein